jgi:hypothetical protein
MSVIIFSTRLLNHVENTTFRIPIDFLTDRVYSQVNEVFSEWYPERLLQVFFY